MTKFTSMIKLPKLYRDVKVTSGYRSISAKVNYIPNGDIMINKEDIHHIATLVKENTDAETVTYIVINEDKRIYINLTLEELHAKLCEGDAQ